MGICVGGYDGTGVHGYMGMWVYGCMGICVYVYMCIWVYGYMGKWVCGYVIEKDRNRYRNRCALLHPLGVLGPQHLSVGANLTGNQ
jgi:hypothetical protein